MKYIFLNNKFFSEYNYNDYPEIERKPSRPYIMLKVSINGFDFGIPLRSTIDHKHVFWTNKKSKCGADYSKAVIIPSCEYIDTKKPYIRADEHKALIGKEYLITKGFEKYINDYKKALSETHIPRKEMLCRCSTLQYYHEELGIKEAGFDESLVN